MSWSNDNEILSRADTILLKKKKKNARLARLLKNLLWSLGNPFPPETSPFFSFCVWKEVKPSSSQ